MIATILFLKLQQHQDCNITANPLLFLSSNCYNNMIVTIPFFKLQQHQDYNIITNPLLFLFSNCNIMIAITPFLKLRQYECF